MLFSPCGHIDLNSAPAGLMAEAQARDALKKNLKKETRCIIKKIK